jgi:hypothetical protein
VCARPWVEIDRRTKLFDDRGNRMGPSHAAKGGRRWRYYISRAILKGRNSDAGSITRVPAAQIEKQVFDAIQSVIASKRSSEGWETEFLSPETDERSRRSAGANERNLERRLR